MIFLCVASNTNIILSSDIPYGVSQSPTKLFYIALTSSIIGAPKIKVTSLDPATGQKLEQFTLSTDGDVTTPESIVHVDSASQAPILVWADKGHKNLKVNILGTKSVVTLAITNKGNEEVEKITIHATDRITAPTHFLALYEAEDSHWGEVFHIDGAKHTIQKQYDVQRLVGKGTVATSVSNHEVFYTRIAKGAFLVLSSAKNEIVDRYALAGFGVDGLLDFPYPIQAVGEVVRKTDSAGLSTRSAVLLSSGDWVLILNGQASWVRNEELSYITQAEFAELPRKLSLVNELEAESHSTLVAAYIHRVKRHISDLKKVPAYLEALPQRIIDLVQGKETEPAEPQSDSFGFHQHVIVSTEHGRLLALDTSNHGAIVWSTLIPGFEVGSVPTIIPTSKGLIRVRTKTEHSVFDTLTGKFLRKGSESSKPKNPPKRITIEYVAQSDRVAGITGQPVNVMWTFFPPPGLEVVTITPRPLVDPVAAIGDVLGDRKVMYKYLNPNLAVINSVNATSNLAAFTLIDTVSGNVLYSVTHKNVDVSRPLPVVLSENFFAYSFTTTDAADVEARGTVLVSTKLYESSIPDDRGPLGAATNFSALNPPSAGGAFQPHVITQAFLVPEEISQLDVSRTRQGITSRLLLAVLPQTGSVAGIPLPILDPRRPVNRDPTKVEAESGLFRYLANLDFDPKWILTHARYVHGLTNIAAAPALLESTSLLFMYGKGGDVFGTRAAPSGTFDVLGKDFNRLQMMATVVALFIGVVMAAPVVRRKTLNLLWDA
jgi:hypothetical protein